MHAQRPGPSEIGAVPSPERIVAEAKRRFQGPSPGLIQSLIVYLILGAIIIGILLFFVRW